MIQGSKFQDDTVVVGRSLRSLEMQINEGVKEVSDQLNEVRTKPTAEREKGPQNPHNNIFRASLSPYNILLWSFWDVVLVLILYQPLTRSGFRFRATGA